jgi:uncharacterized protein (DUF2236 family)
MTTETTDRPVTAPLSPETLADLMDGIAPFVAGNANVIMQLARLPVGRGVAESRVDSGRVDKHPLKRLRTTVSFLVIAMSGTEQERIALRREINRAHAQVHSLPGDPVAYNAFDPELQLWVAACLYRGVEDTYIWLHGQPDDALADAIYAHAARFATTLQVPADAWPADRAAFEKYWEAGVEQIEMDDVTRRYLRGIANFTFLPAPLATVFGPLNRLLTLGFMEQPFREELGMTWDARDQRRFDLVLSLTAAVNRRMPRIVRGFPLNVYLWDVRRRLQNGRRVV